VSPTEILAMFVAKVDSRECLLKPFRIGEFVYATNGHWIARVPGDGLQADDITDKHPKNVEALFDAAPTEGFMPLPKVKNPGVCMTCKGKGFGTTRQCGNCGGRGSFEQDGYDYECQSCDGEGEIFSASTGGPDACPHCYGLGVPDNSGGTKVGAITYANRYLWLLRKLPAIQIAPGQPEKSARLRFKGGEGLLMPYRD